MLERVQILEVIVLTLYVLHYSEEEPVFIELFEILLSCFDKYIHIGVEVELVQL